MGIASLLLGADNPFTQWTDQNQNLLNAIGSGLGQGQNIQSGLTAGLAQVPQAKQLDQQQAEKLKASKLAEQQLNATKNWLQSNHPDLAQMVDAGMPVQEAWQAAMQRMQPKGGAPNALAENATVRQQLADQYGLQGDDKTRFVLTGELPGGNQSVRASVGQPVPMRNRKTGEWAPFAPMSDGTIQNQMTGELANQADWIFDPGAAAADKSAGTAYGTAQGGVQFSLPNAKLNLEQELANIDALKNDTKGREETFGNIAGIPQQWFGATPATAKFGYKQRVEQVVGQNFLQAYQSLKGAGAITEQEGGKAQAAMARLSTAQKQEDFDAALADLEQVLRQGYAVLQQKAGTQFSSGGAAQPPAALTNGNVTSSGVQWSVEP